MSLTDKLLKGSLTRMVNVFLQVVVTFIMTPIIIHALGDRMYGFWILVGTFMGYYGLLDLGLSSAVARYISRAVGQHDAEEANRVINTAFFIFSAIGMLALLLSLLAGLFCGLVMGDPNEILLFRKILVLMGLSMTIGFPMRVFGGILDANLRFDLTTYAAIARLLITNILIYFLLMNGHGVYAIAVVSFFAGLFEILLLVLFARRIFPELRLSLARYSQEMSKQLFGYSGKTFVAQLADILRFRLDAMVIASVLNVSLVTHYSVGARLIEYFSFFMTSAVGMMAPVFSQYEGQNDYAAIRRSLLLATKISIILSMFVGASVLIYGRAFIQRWMGTGFDDSYLVAAILCGGYILALMQVPSTGLLYGISKQQYLAFISICEGVANLVLSLVLVRTYGIYGVAMGTLIPMVLSKILLQPYFVCRAIGLNLHEYLTFLLVTCVKCLVPLVGFYIVIASLLKPQYTTIGALFAIQIVCFAGIFYLFILSREEKQYLTTKLMRAV